MWKKTTPTFGITRSKEKRRRRPEGKKKKNIKGEEKKPIGCCFSNQIFGFMYVFLLSFHLLLQGTIVVKYHASIFFFFFKLQFISWLFWTLEDFVYIYI